MMTATLSAAEDVTNVNPFIGTFGHEHVYSGATVPFGVVQLSPDTIIIWVASLFQLAVACYAMRLNRHFGTARVGWSLFSAFALLALLHLIQASETLALRNEIGIKIEAGYALISLLLLIGLAHIETMFKERQQAERQAQKMEVIGQLTEGIAHDFNNMLAVIQGHVSLLTEMKNDPETVTGLNHISMAVNRSGRLIRQLLTFGGRRLIQTSPLDLNEVIENLTQMLRRLIKQNIALQNVFASNLPPILGDVGMMEQVIMNLVVNAQDAMPCGGKLVLETSVVQVDSAHAKRNREARIGEFIRLRVIDTGSGMPPSVLPHIFEPFFTTKDVGKGTGLGLATVCEIVEEHSGWVEVRSQVKAGTEFTLYFPQAVAPTIKTHSTHLHIKADRPVATSPINIHSP
jgi:signal transduction histidine kinase